MNTFTEVFEASNGWQFRVNESGHVQYKFQDHRDNTWTHLGSQLALGFVEWAQSPFWMEEIE